MLLLTQFLERLDNLRFASQPDSGDKNPMYFVKSLKSTYIEEVAALKKVFERSLAQLEDCLQYYVAT